MTPPRKTATENAAIYADQIKGKVVLTTGISPNSIGSTFVQAIAKSGPAVLILAGRNPAKVQETADSIKAVSSDIRVLTLTLDLMSLQAVRTAAETVNGWSDLGHIDVVVNNAGIMAPDWQASPDGFESQFATNHLGHFLFTNLIMGKLLAAPAPRVVNVSSDGHRLNPIRFADYNFHDGETYEKWQAYGQSKTANCLMAISLAAKFGDKGLRAYSLHPGVIGSNLGLHLDWAKEMSAMNKVDLTFGNAAAFWNFGDFTFYSHEEGSATHVYGAFAPELDEHKNAYLVDSHIADPTVDTVKPWAFSTVDAEMLWTLSEKLVGQKF